MKVSLNWTRKFGATNLPIDKLVEKIGAQLGAVDSVIDLGQKYKGVVVVKVISCAKHPNADKLKVCLIDDGGVVKGAKRNKGGLVEVVCGAANVKEGMLAAWIPPGHIVPSTFDKQPLILEAREIRGALSNGMLASAKELALGDDHEGIVEIDENVRPGTPFAKIYDLDDYIIDIENKMFTHRPDCFGMLGIAREIAGIQHKAFKSPNWYDEKVSIKSDGRKNVLKLSVRNSLPNFVPRFTAIAIKDVRVQPSPLWLQTYLSRVGVRPINNIVDLTNYLMLETAQPLHAYDYDKIKTGVLGVRLSKKGEELTLLGGKTIKLEPDTIVITDGRKPIGLGGVMGGADTEVDAGSKNIILESANFDMNATRLSAMHYGLFTDAAVRFTKKQSPRQCLPVLVLAAKTTTKLAGGRVASEAIDDKHYKKANSRVEIGLDFINQRLGLNLSVVVVKKLLQNVEFEVTATGDKLEIRAPFWRTDIEIREDIVEEVGRLYGYDHLPMKLPLRDLKPAKLENLLTFKSRLRSILSAAGANELLTYSFVDDSLLEKVGQQPKDAYHIRNALSPDLQYYRLSLTPSTLEKVHPNIKSGYGQFVLYEIGKSHVKDVIDREKLPMELGRLSVVVANKSADKSAGAPFYAANKYAANLFNKLSVPQIRAVPMAEAKLSKDWQISARVFDEDRSAVIYSGQQPLGLVGEPTSLATQKLKLPSFSAAFELDLECLLKASGAGPAYQPLNRYPATHQDITLRTPVSYSHATLNGFITDFLDKASAKRGYRYKLETIDIFQKSDDTSHKQTTWRISLEHPKRTLTNEEVNDLLDSLDQEAKKRFKAERI